MDFENGNIQIEAVRENERLTFLSDQLFGNGLIVEKISNKLNLTDFKTFRQLRSSCHLESMSVWRKRACVRFNKSNVTKRSLESFNSFIVLRYGAKENGEIAADIPFQKFSLSGWTAPTQDLRNFTSLCAHQIKDLEIIDFHPYSWKIAEDFIQTVRMLISHTTALHVRCTCSKSCEATFIQVCEVDFPNVTQLRLSFTRSFDLQFLFKFPNLTKLAVSDTIPSSHYWASILFLRTLAGKISERKASYVALTTLDLSRTIFEAGYFDLLVTANFPLSHLALNIPSSEHVDLALLLNHHGRNLVTLTLSIENCRGLPPCKLIPLNIKFENLIMLNLLGNVEDNLDFLMYTPVLAKLKMYQIDPENPSLSGEVTQSQSDIVQSSKHLLILPQFGVPSLREFRTDRMIALTSRNTLRQWMPNLQVFDLPILD